MSEHKILKTEILTDFENVDHTIAKIRSAFSNHTFWAALDDDGNIDLPFGSKRDIESRILRASH